MEDGAPPDNRFDVYQGRGGRNWDDYPRGDRDWNDRVH